MEDRNPELEALILERPDDVTRFLVYGDWLDERKQRRGELMGVQQALSMVTDAAARSRLQTVAAQLIGLEEARIFARVERWGDRDRRPIMLEWRHGFVLGATLAAGEDLDWATALELLTADPASVFLRRLTLSPSRRALPQTQRALLASSWAGLDTLTFAGALIDWAAWLNELGLSRLARVRRLAFNGIVGADALCAGLARWLPQLEELAILRSDLTMQGVDALARAKAKLEVLEVSGNELPLSAKPVLRGLAKQVRFGRQRGLIGDALERGFVLFDKPAPRDVIERTVVQLTKHFEQRDVFLREATLAIGGRRCAAIELLGNSLPLDTVAESLARRAEFLPRVDKFRTMAVAISEGNDVVQVRAFHDGGESFGVAGAMEGPGFNAALARFLDLTPGGAPLHDVCDALDEVPPQLLVFNGQHPVRDEARSYNLEALLRVGSRTMASPPERADEPVVAPEAEDEEVMVCDFCGRELPTWPCDDCEEMNVCEACGTAENGTSFTCPHCRDREGELVDDE